MDQKTLIALVIGLVVGAILHHIFMGRQMKKDAIDAEEVQKFGACNRRETVARPGLSNEKCKELYGPTASMKRISAGVGGTRVCSYCVN
jgi:hypothetical protein